MLSYASGILGQSLMDNMAGKNAIRREAMEAFLNSARYKFYITSDVGKGWPKKKVQNVIFLLSCMQQSYIIIRYNVMISILIKVQIVLIRTL